MFEVISLECTRYGDELIGLIEYHEAVLRKKALIAKEGEFRTNKLCLILDLIKNIDIPESLRVELISEIIDAWKLKIPGRTLRQRDEELEIVLSSIESIRSTINWIKVHANPMAKKQLDVAVLSELPLMPSDLREDDVPRICDRLNQVKDYIIAALEGMSTTIPS